MQWIAISGSWRTDNAAVEQDVRLSIQGIILQGDGIVTGGALGVDQIATDEALKHDPSASYIKIILPTSLKDYANHLFNRAGEGVISHTQAQSVIDQLTDLKNRNSNALIEMEYTVCNQESYYARNTKVIEAADQLMAFQVNGSQGTQDAIDKASARGMPVRHKKYQI